MYAIRSYYEAKIDEFIKQWQSPSKNEKSRFMLTAEEGKNLKNILDKLIETGFGQKLSEKQVNRRGAEKSVPGEKITMPEIISKLESMAAKRGTARNEKHRITSYNVCYTKLLRRTEGEEVGKDPLSGNNLRLTLDFDVQKAAFDALGNNRGTVVVIKPSTGEILTMVSKPSYDPNLIIS